MHIINVAANRSSNFSMIFLLHEFDLPWCYSIHFPVQPISICFNVSKLHCHSFGTFSVYTQDLCCISQHCTFSRSKISWDHIANPIQYVTASSRWVHCYTQERRKKKKREKKTQPYLTVPFVLTGVVLFYLEKCASVQSIAFKSYLKGIGGPRGPIMHLKITFTLPCTKYTLKFPNPMTMKNTV